MKDIYEMLPIHVNSEIFETSRFINYVDDLQNKISNDQDIVHSNFEMLEGNGIFDTILNVGKSLIGALNPIAKTVSDVGKVVNSSSEVYSAIKKFKQPAKKPTKVPIKKRVLKEEVEEEIEQPEVGN